MNLSIMFKISMKTMMERSNSPTDKFLNMHMICNLSSVYFYPIGPFVDQVDNFKKLRLHSQKNTNVTSLEKEDITIFLPSSAAR